MAIEGTALIYWRPKMTIKIRITEAVAFELEASACEHIPDWASHSGTHEATVEEVLIIFAEAKYYTDPGQFDIGPHGLPLGTFNAFRALKKQCQKLLSA
jgi:hypothetical protein